MNKNCEEIRRLFPEYLSRQLNEKQMYEINNHIEQCDECKKELEDIKNLNNMILNSNNFDNSFEKNNDEYYMAKIMKKTRRKFYTKVSLSVIFVMIAVFILYIIVPQTVRFIKHRGDYHNGFNADTVVSAITPLNTHGLTGFQKGFTDEIAVSASYNLGKSEKNVPDINAKLNVVTDNLMISPTNLQNYYFLGELTRGKNSAVYPLSEENIKKNHMKMEKNKDNTVVLVDMIFNEPISLMEVAELKKKYDLDFEWAALKSDDDKINSLDAENHVGLSLSYAGFSLLDFDEEPYIEGYKKQLQDFIEKSIKYEDNKYIYEVNRIYKDAINNNLSKINGVRITGPTNEVLRMINEMKINVFKVQDMDFYDWNK